MAPRFGPLDSQPCRQCSSFADYVKNSRKKAAAESEVKDCEVAHTHKIKSEDCSNVMKPPRADCPLDKDALGNGTWGLLHTMAAKYPDKPTSDIQKDMKDFFRILSRFYPCDHCAHDLRIELKADPPQVESQHSLSQWLCKLHNRVNVKIGKPEFDCSKVNERWRDGWKDGSCDI